MPDALDVAIQTLERGELSDRDRRAFLKEVVRLTSYAWPVEAAPDWLSHHLGHFRFDPIEHRYSLKD